MVTKNHKNIDTTNDSQDFAEAFAKEAGKELDLNSVLDLNTDFVDAGENYLLVNIKEYGSENPNNVLLLTDTNALLFSLNPPSLKEVDEFTKILTKPFGKSTALVLVTLHKVLSQHKKILDTLMARMTQIERKFVHAEYRDLSVEFERFGDRLEEFHDLLIRLQERKYKQIETQYVSFDYRVLIAESQSLQSRCRRRSNYLKDLRQDHEMMATEDLNHRIVKLNEDVKRLTAITVILMLPNLIAGHFGMNFAYMPELKVAWAYPAVIGFQVLFMGIGVLIFRRMKWL
jgi:hypothetical protein